MVCGTYGLFAPTPTKESAFAHSIVSTNRCAVWQRGLPARMVGAATRLGHVEPRERAGAQTGRKYEYQYERTARAALDLLSGDTKHVCIYCDWHDDYVVETGDTFTRYVFHQVKGRKSSQGPWTFGDFFGVGLKKAKTVAKKPPAISDDAIVPRMLTHYANFGDNCAGIAFVTNTGLHRELSEFLAAVAASADATSLPPEVCIAFDHVARAYAATTPPLVSSPDDLFAWMRSLVVHTDQGQLESSDAALLEIAARVAELSEIDLRQRQAKVIARQVVERVRLKVSHSTTVVPASDDQLRQDKGIVVAELLSVLSLSTEAYKALLGGASADAVKTLSRLQRFCDKHPALKEQIVTIAEFKARWDVWRTIERHNVSSTDFLLLETRANEVLKGEMRVEKVVTEAKDIAKQFSDVGVTPLTPEDVMGLIFEKAALSEALT